MKLIGEDDEQYRPKGREGFVVFFLRILVRKGDGDGVLLLLWCLMMREMRVLVCVCVMILGEEGESCREREREDSRVQRKREERGPGRGDQKGKRPPLAHTLRPKNNFKRKITQT